ncbi:MAG TPA: SDR family NAD(P)-dependent oxidoreductase [Rhizomicrobium sp.]|jgi:3-oxoacyl-[acyl-carrier protein] reductase|nr:SDR family NAD(P)-dependent oxidoreductase [Rhizomicrobium sp.]
MSTKNRFDMRCAVITGGASGLGKETAKRLIGEGAKVALWDLNAETLDRAKQEVGATHSVALDVCDPAQVAAAAAESAKALGKIDILVNSAGITGATAMVQEYPLDSWRRVIDINLNGLFYCCRAVVPFLLANKYGRIVNVSSVAGKEGNPNMSAYSASKAGVIGLTKSLGKELAPHNVMVNAITPATFESPILDQLPQSQIDYMRSKIPMGRLGVVSEVAAMICFMASEECSFTTAATFDISGGRTTF